MKRILILLLFLLSGCHSVKIPPEFKYEEINTSNFTIASWQKIKNPNAVYKIYIEGDGYAFNAHGYPSSDPTPHGTLMRELAFGDTNPNIIYSVLVLPRQLNRQFALRRKIQLK